MADASALLQSNAPGSTALQLISGPTGIFIDRPTDAMVLPVPTFDEAYAESPDTEGGQRSRSRPQNPVGSIRVNIVEATSSAFWLSVERWQQIVNEIHDWGGTLIWTPVNGQQVTYDIQSMFITDLPQYNPYQAQNAGSSSASITTLPYGRLATQTNVLLSDIDTFSRDSLTNQEWRFINGSGTVSVSGGVLLPSSTSQKTLFRPVNVINATSYLKFTTGSSVATFIGIEAIMKLLDPGTNANFLFFGIEDGNVKFNKVDATVSSSLNSQALSAGLSTSTTYWLKFDIAGNVMTVTLYTSDPNGSSPTAPVLGTPKTFTLTGGDATKFGSGVKGCHGIRVQPNASFATWSYDDYRMDSGSMEGFDPMLNFELIGKVPGSAPAQMKLRLTDAANQPRNYGEWSLDDRFYDKTAPPVTLLDSDTLVTTGFAGSQTTRSGSYDPAAAGNNVIRATLTPSSAAVCGTGSQPHIGPLKIRARLFGSGTGQVYVRLAYRIADGGWSRTSWVPLTNMGGFSRETLGTIRVPQFLVGTQAWEGKVEAYSETIGDTLDVDFIQVLPARRYGRVRGVVASEPSGGVIAYDGFAQGSVALTGQVAPLGGTWTVGAAGASTAEDGDADDFSITTGQVATRNPAGADSSLTNGRYVCLNGSSTISAVDVQCDCYFPDLAAPTSNELRGGVLLRFVDTDNWVLCNMRRLGGKQTYLNLWKRVAGTVTPLAGVLLFNGYVANQTVKAYIDTAGIWVIFSGPVGGTLTPRAFGQQTDFATGGPLDDGRVGIYDGCNLGSAGLRSYDNFIASTAASTSSTIQPVIPGNGNFEVRHNGVFRSTGAKLVPEGAYLYIDPSGKDLRSAQMTVGMTRNDTETAVDDQIADALKAEVDITPRVVLLDG